MPVAKQHRPPSPLRPNYIARDVPKQKDIVVPQEKTIQEPALVASKTPAKAPEKEKEDKEKREEEKTKEKDKGHKMKKEKDHEEKQEKDKEKEGGQPHKELKAGVADMVRKLGTPAPSSGGGHERAGSAAAEGTTIITLAGENKGASMKVDGSAVADGRADAAGSKERRGRTLDGSAVVSGTERAWGGRGFTAFVNSNVQVINNSLLLQSSCNGGGPGVHLKLSTKAKKKDGKEAGGNSGSAAAPKK